MKHLILILPLLLVCPVMAQTQFAWDYDVVEETKIEQFQLWQTKNPGQYPGFDTSTPKEIFAKTTRSGVTADPASYGKWCFVLTAYAGSLNSDPSNEVCKNFKPPKPNNFRETVITAMTYPMRKVGGFFSSLFSGDKQLRIIDE